MKKINATLSTLFIAVGLQTAEAARPTDQCVSTDGSRAAVFSDKRRHPDQLAFYGKKVAGEEMSLTFFSKQHMNPDKARKALYKFCQNGTPASHYDLSASPKPGRLEKMLCNGDKGRTAGFQISFSKRHTGIVFRENGALRLSAKNVPLDEKAASEAAAEYCKTGTLPADIKSLTLDQ